MIFPYTYRGAIIQGFYTPSRDSKKMRFTAYVEHPLVQGITGYLADSLEQAQQMAETAIDELIASWN